MRPLALVVADDDPERLRTALVMAAAQAALGGQVSMFFQGAAVGLLRHPVADPDEARQSGAGLPTLSQLLDEALGLGVMVAACQSSLALLGMQADAFDARIMWSGMVSMLAALDPESRLVVV